MNRDPEGKDCTRDPIYLLQVGQDVWSGFPDGFKWGGEDHEVTDLDSVPDWVRPFIGEDGHIEAWSDFVTAALDHLNADGYSMVHINWRTERVFLTRAEAEEYRRAHEYRWTRSRVYCMPCEGRLAQILNDYEDSATMLEVQG